MRTILATILISLPYISAMALNTDPAVADSLTVLEQTTDSLPEIRTDTIIRLTDDDYREVAEHLGVETAAIKAVVDIEAGRTHQGFFAPGKPIINFDLTMFRRFARKHGINLSRYNGSHAIVFSRPNARRHGSTQAAQHARLDAARGIDDVTAIEGTFWGMFQIGGFNWKLCGCDDIHDFVNKMSTSERAQLDLFAEFIRRQGLDKYLRNKNWAAFASRYNGPSYASRRYHTRMASAYARHKKLETAAAKSTTAKSATAEAAPVE